MTNLLHLVVELAGDRDARDRFRQSPEGHVSDIDDLTVEDVAAVIDVARLKVEPGLAAHLTDALELPSASSDDAPRAVAVRALLDLCDAVEAHTGPTTGD